MGDVIGLDAGSPNERAGLWRAMINYKSSYETFINRTGAWEQRIAKRDKEMYDRHLSYYAGSREE